MVRDNKDKDLCMFVCAGEGLQENKLPDFRRPQTRHWVGSINNKRAMDIGKLGQEKIT